MLDRRSFLTRSGTFLALPFAPRIAFPLQKPAPSGLLAEKYPAGNLASLLLPLERWRPFPAVGDRAAWQALAGDLLESFIEGGERRRGAAWQPLPAVLFLQYSRDGNRSNYERVRSGRRAQLAALVLAECAQGEGRFLDDIANGIWTTCEETFWGVPAHLNMQRAGAGLPDVSEPVVDLFAAETSSLLAWTDYLLGARLDPVSPLVRQRIHFEVDRRILTPCLERTDFWWMGLDEDGRRDLNNWTPWINSNWLTSALLLETSPDKRLAAVHKILRSLDRFLAGYHPDGGCDEGPGYWFRAGGSLFDCLELLHSASDGRIDFYSIPLIGEIGRYIYRAHIAEDYFINFADASAKVRAAGDLVFRYGRRIADPRMEGLGAYAAEREGWRLEPGESLGRLLCATFNLPALKAATPSQPFLRDVWWPGIQVMAARTKDGSKNGLYLAAQGGHNAESHNHNDVGNFIVYADGQPVIVDVGVETYSAKTFSSRRYEIWTMQSAYHNLPTIGGVMQGAGRSFAAKEVQYHSDDSGAELSLELASAYPPESNLDSWRRILRLDRQRNEVEVRDTYVLKKPVARITQTLMTACKVSGTGGQLVLEGKGSVTLAYDPTVYSAVTEEIRIDDARLKSAWGDRLYRILLTADHPPVRNSTTLRIAQR